MSALRTSLRRGAVWALLLAPLAAQGTLHLHGPRDWYAGQAVVFEVKADADTLLEAYQFLTDDSISVDVYATNAVPGIDGPIATLPMSSVLQITNDPNASLLEVLPSALCNPGLPLCIFSSALPVMISKDTVLTRWEFLVREDSPVWDLLTAGDQGHGIALGLPPGDPFDGFDDPIEGVFYFDLGAAAVQQSGLFLPVSWWREPGVDSTEFQLLAIPESSSWTLMLAGLLLTGGVCAYRRIHT